MWAYKGGKININDIRCCDELMKKIEDENITCMVLCDEEYETPVQIPMTMNNNEKSIIPYTPTKNEYKTNYNITERNGMLTELHEFYNPYPRRLGKTTLSMMHDLYT